MNAQDSNFNNSRVKSTRSIELELLALDLDTCSRCVGTLGNIETAIDKVKNILEITGTEINVNKIRIESEEVAKAHRFVTSPTIRINGYDIVFETLESECDSCTDLCGYEDGIACRVWRYQGQEYTEAPVGLIFESLMAEIYGGRGEIVQETENYTGVPENLQRFFLSKGEKQAPKVAACCSTEKQETCCEPSEKDDCCATEEPETCGCQ